MLHRISIVLALVAAMALSLCGCKDDVFEHDASLFSVTVQVLFPEHYNVDPAQGVTVRLVNLDNRLYSTQVANEQGYVTFANVVRGKYRISTGYEECRCRGRCPR